LGARQRGKGGKLGEILREGNISEKNQRGQKEEKKTKRDSEGPTTKRKGGKKTLRLYDLGNEGEKGGVRELNRQ